MRRIIAIEAPSPGETPADALTLDFDHRNRRRIVLTSDGGEPLLLDLPRAVHMRDGDIARLDDGSAVLIRAADEALVEIRAADSAALVRVAWHLGNRHLPTQLLPGPDGGRLRIRADHVIRAMAEGLGARCLAVEAPFDPEGGAYSGGHRHHGAGHAPGGHSHDGHHHDHHHDHGHA